MTMGGLSPVGPVWKNLLVNAGTHFPKLPTVASVGVTPRIFPTFKIAQKQELEPSILQ